MYRATNVFNYNKPDKEDNMIGVLIVIALFVSLLFIVNAAEEAESLSQWPRPWDKL